SAVPAAALARRRSTCRLTVAAREGWVGTSATGRTSTSALDSYTGTTRKVERSTPQTAATVATSRNHLRRRRTATCPRNSNLGSSLTLPPTAWCAASFLLHPTAAGARASRSLCNGPARHEARSTGSLSPHYRRGRPPAPNGGTPIQRSPRPRWLTRGGFARNVHLCGFRSAPVRDAQRFPV